MMKQFSIARDTQKGSQSYMEKRRGRGKIEMTRSRRRGIKRREIDLSSTLFPKCSTQPAKPIKQFTELG